MGVTIEVLDMNNLTSILRRNGIAGAPARGRPWGTALLIPTLQAHGAWVAFTRRQTEAQSAEPTRRPVLEYDFFLNLIQNRVGVIAGVKCDCESRSDIRIRAAEHDLRAQCFPQTIRCGPLKSI
jgi:hypothetical protein